ncbi:hypothetical protein G7K_3555-t1 [Saitoella complicata NRRL Y-17804]|uniref:Uncharacterized protein n=1 Tax=Saitoella complicata (strain BCRC 22490 / CBS 7301 / JCM 7358 / NBRC 10748 / NRRL Y-17804) TaxID=698492 RepID=A0A0E9NJ36_SAICN|nr:hypothetical protein G7K_3555-t1 [Saitoella complicata NRRL Y-17804]
MRSNSSKVLCQVARFLPELRGSFPGLCLFPFHRNENAKNHRAPYNSPLYDSVEPMRVNDYQKQTTEPS